MTRTMQAHYDEICPKGLGSLQDHLTGHTELDHEFRLDSEWSVLFDQFLEPLEGSPAGIVPHFPDIASGAGPMKALRNRGDRSDMKQNQFHTEVVGEGDGAGQSVHRGRTKICSEQKGSKCAGVLERRIQQGTRAYGQHKTIGMPENLLRDGTEEQFPEASPTVRTDDNQVNLFLRDYRLQFFPNMSLADDKFMVQSGH